MANAKEKVKKSNQLTNIVVPVIHMSTSKKISDEFKGEYPTKTGYITVKPEDAQKLIEFGLRKYTSEATKEEPARDFFIVKLSAKVAVYEMIGDGKPDSIDGGAENDDLPNFEVDDLKVNIIHGEKSGNKFFRIQALEVKSMDDIKNVEQQNPFEVK